MTHGKLQFNVQRPLMFGILKISAIIAPIAVGPREHGVWARVPLSVGGFLAATV
jgi:hypothetical protein